MLSASVLFFCGLSRSVYATSPSAAWPPQRLGHSATLHAYAFDRGYPRWELIERLERLEIRYVMRAQRSFSREADEAGEGEGERARGKRPEVRYYQLRLSGGETELLLTDLRHEEADGEELRERYRRRWEIATKYDAVKNQLELENGSGRTVEKVKQE